MDRYVCDQYKNDVRFTLTAVLFGIACAMFQLDAAPIGGFFMLAAAVAFHTESKLVLDPATRTYRRGTFVKPFGSGKTGPFEDIRSIMITTFDSPAGYGYSAAIVFNTAPYEGAIRYVICAGSMDQVIKTVRKLVKSTGLKVEESEGVVSERRGLESIADLVG